LAAAVSIVRGGTRKRRKEPDRKVIIDRDRNLDQSKVDWT
jgi:hypothetical protein